MSAADILNGGCNGSYQRLDPGFTRLPPQNGPRQLPINPNYVGRENEDDYDVEEPNFPEEPREEVVEHLKTTFIHRIHFWHLTIIFVLFVLFIASIACFGILLAEDSTEYTKVPPNITYCPVDMTRSSPLEGPTPVPVWWVEPSVANPSGDEISYEASHEPGDIFEIGNTTVTYNFTGHGGLMSICEFRVSVILLDGSPPTISHCPTNIEANAPEHDNRVQVNWTEPTAESERSVTTIKPDPDQSPGSYFGIGTTFINYVFVDSMGFQSSCSFLISVLDVTPPLIKNCPQDISFNVSHETDSPSVSWVDPEATDNSGEATLVRQSHKPDDSFPVGATSVEYVYADPSGNINLCSFVIRVIVLDGTPPTVSNCPDNISPHAPDNDNKIQVTWTEPTSESERPVTAIKPDPDQSPGSFFSIGTTAINYVFVDSIGLRSSCSFFISVLDVILPVVHQCPSDVAFAVTSENSLKSVVWIEPEATDNSGKVSLVSQTHHPGYYFPVGSTAVQYVFKDPTGNINLCSFFVKGKVASPSSGARIRTASYGIALISAFFTIFLTTYMFT